MINFGRQTPHSVIFLTQRVCLLSSTPYLSSYLTAWSMGRCLRKLWDAIPFTHTTGNQQRINRKRKVTENENKVSCVSHSEPRSLIGYIG